MRASGPLFCVVTAVILTAWAAVARSGDPPPPVVSPAPASARPIWPEPAADEPASAPPVVNRSPQPAAPAAAQPAGLPPTPAGTATPSSPTSAPAPLDDAGPSDANLPKNSISCGSANRGSLRVPAELPRTGRGYVIPEPWWSRDRHFGTDELVDVIQRAAISVANQYPGAMLGVADLSRAKGGAITGHRSHQSGRDADLIFYALDAQGQPFQPDNHMAYYSRSGRAHYAKAPKYDRTITERFFDLPRNWALVKVLMTDTQVNVEHMFVSRRIRRWLLRYAETIQEDPALIKRASRILKRPASTGGHNDHMHIRVSCTQDDITRGRCKNSIARGRRKFYSRVRCPARPRSETPSTPEPKKRSEKNEPAKNKPAKNEPAKNEPARTSL